MNLEKEEDSSPKRVVRAKVRSVYPDTTSPRRKKVDFSAQQSESPKRSSRDGSVQASSSIDETQPVQDFAEHLLVEPRRSLKSCMSAPNLSGMANMKRNISFSKIEIREYERTIGDNPCVSAGPPLALGWKYNPQHTVFDIEEYEDAKDPRSKAEMLMPRHVREVTLKEYWGVSRSEMKIVAKDINVTKRNRRATAQSSNATEKRHENLEKASRKVKRIVSLGKKKDEKKLWKDVKTTCGKRVYSMNDLSAYTAVMNANAAVNDSEPRALDPSTKSQCVSQDSLSSSGNESATSLPVMLLDDDDWGFGLDEDE